MKMHRCVDQKDKHHFDMDKQDKLNIMQEYALQNTTDPKIVSAKWHMKHKPYGGSYGVDDSNK